MRTVFIVQAFLAASAFVECIDLPAPESCGIDFRDRLLGTTIAGLSNFPWTANLVYRMEDGMENLYWCGGSLISDRYVLTAASCVDDLNAEDFQLESVRLGEWDLLDDPDCDEVGRCADPPLNLGVEKIIPHPEYSRETFYNDIALIRLSQSVNFTYFISPLCLPVAKASRALNTDKLRFSVAGWGNTIQGNKTIEYGSRFKHFIELSGVNRTHCKDKYPRLHTSQLCAGSAGGWWRCFGDSGSALTTIVDDREYGYGISSNRKACRRRDCPSCSWTFPLNSARDFETVLVYTRITSFMDWILEQE